jgi:hypothetical protein
VGLVPTAARYTLSHASDVAEWSSWNVRARLQKGQMQTSVPLTEKQQKAMLPFMPNVGEIYRTLDWLRDSILNENRKEFRTVLGDLRRQLGELEALVYKRSRS